MFDLFKEFGELAGLVFHQVLWAVVFEYFTEAEDQYFVTIHDCVESMSYSEDCAISQTRINQRLNSLLRNNIDIRSSFIEDDNLGFPNDGSTDADHLFLT